MCLEEAGHIVQLRAVTDVFVQNDDCRPLEQLPAGARNIFQRAHHRQKGRQCLRVML